MRLLAITVKERKAFYFMNGCTVASQTLCVNGTTAKESRDLYYVIYIVLHIECGEAL